MKPFGKPPNPLPRINFHVHAPTIASSKYWYTCVTYLWVHTSIIQILSRIYHLTLLAKGKFLKKGNYLLPTQTKIILCWYIMSAPPHPPPTHFIVKVDNIFELFPELQCLTAFLSRKWKSPQLSQACESWYKYGRYVYICMYTHTRYSTDGNSLCLYSNDVEVHTKGRKHKIKSPLLSGQSGHLWVQQIMGKCHPQAEIDYPYVSFHLTICATSIEYICVLIWLTSVLSQNEDHGKLFRWAVGFNRQSVFIDSVLMGVI